MNIPRIYFLYLAVFSILVFIGGMFTERHLFSQELQEGKVDFSEINTKYKFINPLLFCQDQNLPNQGAEDIETAVGNYINQEKANNDLIDAAFYFKDLNGGPWALVNPNFQSTPASLLKVPIAISVYQRAEEDPGFLNTKTTMPNNLTGTNIDLGEYFPVPEKVEPNTTYTVEDLVRLMLEDSDNNAVYMLSNFFNLPELESSYTHLGIETPSSANQGYTITVQTFASFFRVLYSGTYLTQNDSEHVLSLLSQSTFTQGIVAGVPAGTVVSHKFGEAYDSDGTLQLNDCGIVYKPNHPYLICIMTKGTSYDTLAGDISHISGMVYDAVNSSD